VVFEISASLSRVRPLREMEAHSSRRQSPLCVDLRITLERR
jgi:hypothetical protein